MIDDKEFERLYNYYEPSRRKDYINIEIKLEDNYKENEDVKYKGE